MTEKPIDSGDGGKSAQRRHFRALRDDYVVQMHDQDRHRAFSIPPTPLATLFTEGRIVAGYCPFGSEADPRQLMRAARDRGCLLALPHVSSRSQPMRFLRGDLDGPLETGLFGLSQPPSDSPSCSPNILLVPLVAFDRSGHRLGQGAGFYDRALSLLPDAITIGVAWSVQEADHLAPDPWDVPLHAILTEKEWIMI